MEEPHLSDLPSSFTYNLLSEFSGESLQAESPSIHKLSRAVYFKEPLSDISQECVSKLPLSVLACHAQHGELLLVDVVEQVVGDLEGLLGVTLDAFHQLDSDLLEVPCVLGIVDKNHIITLGDKYVQD